MIKERLGSDLDSTVRRIFPFVAHLKVHPDVMTLVGVVMSALAGWAFAMGRPHLGGLGLMVAGFFDLTDGIVARQQGLSSRAGAFFDSTMDRVSDVLIFGGIAVGMAAAADPWGTVLVMWALGASVLTSYARARAECELADLSVGLMERGERFGVLILAALLGFVKIGLWIIALGATYTAVQRVLAARRHLTTLEATGLDPTLSSVAPEEESDVRSTE